MSRPTKLRKIENVPSIAYFVPPAQEVSEIPENILKLEELEAIRLKDMEGGNFTLNICPIRCLDCGREWMESFEKLFCNQLLTYARNNTTINIRSKIDNLPD